MPGWLAVYLGWGVLKGQWGGWRVLPLAALLVLAACLLAVVGMRTVRAYQELRNEERIQAVELVGVRPWMTIPYIARVYEIPEDELFRLLGLPQTEERRHLPLQALARQEGRDLGADIATLNAAIDARRETPGSAPTPAPQRVP